nr:hypothetical protein [Tanacetum cinerariifolium]
MAALIISISSDSFEESMGSHAPRVILFGTIPAIIPVILEVPIAPANPIVAPKVGAVFVISPTEVLDLVDYSSSSDSDSLEDSLTTEQRPERQESLIPSSEFPLAPVVAPAEICQRPAILVRPRSAPLSTLYLPTTSESSRDSSSKRSLDSSSPSSRPSRKRCRSLTTLVSREEHMEMGTPDAETVVDLGISEGVRAHTEDGIDLGVEVATSDIREDEEDFKAKASEGGMMDITVDPLATSYIYEPTGEMLLILRRQLKAGQLEASKERAGLADRIRSLGWDNLRLRALLCIERYRVDSLRRHMAFSQEEFR